MTDRAELKEKVVAAIRDAWNNASNDGNPISYYLADAAIAVALEGVARVISEMPRTHTTVKMCDVMGMKAEVTLTLNNGPAECAAAIRAMIKEG